MTDQKKIKTFSEFMTGSKIRKFMNHLVIEGELKTWFLGKSKKFELHIYYTPVKNIILEIKNYSSEISLDELKLDFGKGDNIQKAKDWSNANGHKITVDISRTNY